MLDHIDITVKDLNRSKEFYRLLLSALGINGFSSDINGVKFYDKKRLYLDWPRHSEKISFCAFSAQDKKQVDDFLSISSKHWWEKYWRNLRVRMITIIHVTS